MMGRRFALLLLLPLLCACAGGNTPDAPEPEPLTLNTTSMFGGTDPNAKIYQALTTAYQTEFPHVTISDRSTNSNEQWKQQIATDFATGNEPDVIHFFTDNNAANVLAARPFVTIGEIRSQYPDYAQDVSEAALRAVAAPDGTRYAVPTSGFYEGLYCNKELFDRFHLPLPTDWEKFLRAVEVFRFNGVTPIAVSLGEIPHYLIDHLILSMGGVEEHSLDPIFPPKSWVAGLELLKTLREAGAFPKNTDTLKNADAERQFLEGEAAMRVDGSWFMGGVPDQENTVILPFPVAPGGQKHPSDILAGFSSGFYITKRAWNNPEKREAAVRFVMKHTSAEALAAYWNGAGLPVLETTPPPQGLSPLMESGADMIAAAQGSDSSIDSRLSPEAWQALVRRACDVSNGTLEAEDALESALSWNR